MNAGFERTKSLWMSQTRVAEGAPPLLGLSLSRFAFAPTGEVLADTAIKPLPKAEVPR
jgi:hypothetical protein